MLFIKYGIYRRETLIILWKYKRHTERRVTTSNVGILVIITIVNFRNFNNFTHMPCGFRKDPSSISPTVYIVLNIAKQFTHIYDLWIRHGETTTLTLSLFPKSSNNEQIPHQNVWDEQKTQQMEDAKHTCLIDLADSQSNDKLIYISIIKMSSMRNRCKWKHIDLYDARFFIYFQQHESVTRRRNGI